MAKSNAKRVRASEAELKDKLVAINRVTKVTKGGKKLSFRAVVVIGDANGKVGVGVAKADDVVNAFKKAKADGRKNLIKLPITKSLSIPHDVIGNFGACKVIMRPSIEGSGVIAGGAMRAVLEIAGIQNVLAKSQGSSNPHNVIKATIDALSNLRSANEIARQRGLSLEQLFNG